MSVLVLAIGNRCRHDDGAGPAVAERLTASQPAPAGLEVRELDGEPGRVVDAWTGVDHVVIIDACRSGAPPGTVFRLEPPDDELGPTRPAASTHGVGVAWAYRLGQALHRLPRRLTVFAIEGEDFTAGTGLSPDVATAATDVALEIEAMATLDV